jgi:two-component system, NtrC family, response regulator AtoC
MQKRTPAVPIGTGQIDLACALPRDEVLFGSSDVMAELRRRAEKISQTDVPALLCGDPGTGKETLARWIHAHSAFADGLFLKVNCSAIRGALVESELFGYEKGAFTGALTTKPGRVELAHNGTLFLDEIAECDNSTQTKLLHFLQDGRYSRVGDSSERSVKTRVICSTIRDLGTEIDRGRFRSDLFYRIGAVQLRLPRLSERREDIPLIAEHLRITYAKQFDKPAEPFAVEFLSGMLRRSWPGNIRELANNVARYVLMGPETVLHEQTSARSPRWISSAGADHVLPLKQVAIEAIRKLERQVILETLQANHWNRRRTAQALKISYRSLVYKIRDAGLPSRKPAQRSRGVPCAPEGPSPKA